MMPSIEENKTIWEDFAWSEEGEEWSQPWGGSRRIWFGVILPRIHPFVFADRILEIAPGFGRFSQYLKNCCRELLLVDLMDKCIAHCRKRFESSTHIKYFVNDGKSLDMLEENSVDFVFSYDSLVHVECDVIESYLRHLAVRMRNGSFGFIHHSNLGALKDPMTGQVGAENPSMRAESMTAGLFREYCKEVGLQCISQELIAWRGEVLEDCFSLFSRDDAVQYKETRVIERPDFMSIESALVKRVGDQYDPNALKE